MKAALVILDGWGLTDGGTRDGNGETGAPGEDAGAGPSGVDGDGAASASAPAETREHLDAVASADTPAFDRLRASGAFGTLTAYGRDVGLPNDQMGNSEVGHVNIGAGRTVYQEYTRINDAVEAGELATNEAIAGAFEHAAASGGRVHFAGLVSDGGVHSDQAHLHALVEAAADRGVDAVTHAFTDGRDTAPESGTGFLADLEAAVDEHGTGHVATVTGRYYAMDRDENWERTRRAYDAVVNREAEHVADSAVEAAAASYERGDTDEFVEPTLVAGGRALLDGDAVVCFNFRADRARQLVRMLADIRPGDWEAEGVVTDPPDVHVATMTEYDATFDLPVAFPPRQPEDTLGEVLSEAGFTQLRIAESEKYAHVTYFLNGGREVEFPGERREILPSPDVPTYDMRPEMSAAEVTDTALSVIERDDPDVLVLNYANPDMVGHTGDFDAAVRAVEAVDEQLGRLAAGVLDAGGHLLVTADHGNADDMGTPGDPHTAHTFAPVPFVYVAPDGRSGSDSGDADGDAGWNANGEAVSDWSDGGRRVRPGGSLPDVAPTLLALVGLERPSTMTGTSLLE